MKPGACAFCEEPLPDGRLEGYCDETCQDLHGRTIDSKSSKTSRAMRNSWLPLLRREDKAILKDEPRMKALPEEESS